MNTSSSRIGRVLIYSSFVALAATASPVHADGLTGLIGMSRMENDFPTGSLPPARADRTIRRAAPGRENIVALLGGSPDGSREERYTQNLVRRTGGRYLHGDYDLDDLVGTMLPEQRARRPIDSLFFTGHLTGRHTSKLPGYPVISRQQPYVPVLETGNRQDDRILNIDNQFFSRYDARMAELGLTPDQVWAPGSQIVFKNCNTGAHLRPFLDEWADRVPPTTTIEAYTTEFNWNDHTKWELTKSDWLKPYVNWRNAGIDNLGRQEKGLTIIRGRWQPEQPPIVVEPTVQAEAPVSAPGGLSSGASEASVELAD